jgi:hypothetical protein
VRGASPRRLRGKRGEPVRSGTPASRGRRSPAGPVSEPGGAARRRRRLRARAGRFPGSVPGASWPGPAGAPSDSCPGRDPGSGAGRRRRRGRAGRASGATSAVAVGRMPSPATGSDALADALSAPGEGAATEGRRRRRRRLRSRKMGRVPGASSGGASAPTSLPLPLAGVIGAVASVCGAVAGSPETDTATGLRRRRRLRRGEPSFVRACGAGSPDEVVLPGVASGTAAAASGRGLLASCPAASPASDSIGSRAGPSLACDSGVCAASRSGFRRQLYRPPEIKGSAGGAALAASDAGGAGSYRDRQGRPRAWPRANQRCGIARRAALATAFKEAVTMSLSMPTP